MIKTQNRYYCYIALGQTAKNSSLHHKLRVIYNKNRYNCSNGSLIIVEEAPWEFRTFNSNVLSINVMCSNHIQKIPCIFNLFRNTYNQSFGVFDARRYVSSNESQIAWQVSAKNFSTVDLSILNAKLKLFCDIPVARNPGVNSSFSSANMPFLNHILFNFSSSSDQHCKQKSS